MKHLSRVLMILLAIGMLTACGGSSGDSDSSAPAGNVVKMPVFGGLVTVTDSNGVEIVSASDNVTTNTQGGFTLPVTPAASQYPLEVTVTGGVLYDGDATTTDPANNSDLTAVIESEGDGLYVTSMSTLLHSMWKELGGVGGGTAALASAKAQAKGLLKMLGINAPDNTFTANPIDPGFEYRQQQLLALIGSSDASGLTNVKSRIANLANQFVVNGPASVVTAVQTYTGVTLANAAAVKQFLADQKTIIKANAIAALAGTTAFGSITSADMDTAADSEDTDANLSSPVAAGIQVTTFSAAGMSGAGVAYTLPNGGNVTVSYTAVGIDTDGTATGSPTVTVDGTSATAGSGTFVVDTSEAGDTTVVFTYTNGGVTITRTVTITVLAAGEGALTVADLTAEALRFTDSDGVISAGAAATTGTHTSASATIDKVGTAASSYVASFGLPSNVRYFDGTNYWTNYDVAVSSSDFSGNTATVTLPSVTLYANSDINAGDKTWSFKVWDADKSNVLLTDSDDAVLYSTGIANEPRSFDAKYLNKTVVTYGPAAASPDITLDTTVANQAITLDAANFTGSVTTWANSATGGTSCSAVGSLSVIVSHVQTNSDPLSVNYGFNTTDDDWTVSTGSIDTSCNVSFTASTAPFYPLYNDTDSNANIDLIRVVYDPVTTGLSDVVSNGITFERDEN